MRYIYLLVAVIATVAGIVAGEAISGATADQWLADPEAAAKAAGATADKLNGLSAGWLAAIGTGAMTVLYAAKAFAPIISKFIPVYGAIFEGVANMAWGIAATKDQKKTDQIKEVSHNAISDIAPVIAAFRSLPPGTLPKEIEDKLKAPIVQAALDHVEQLAKV